MFQVISEISVNGFVGNFVPTCNEDSVYSSDNFLVVIDGATGLNGVHLTDDGSDAAWMSKRLCNILKSELHNYDVTVPDILKKAAKQIKSELDDMGYSRLEKSYPSAGIAIIRQIDNFLECFSLGDVPVLLSCKNGSVHCVCDDALSKLDKIVIQRMKEIYEQTNCSMAEARQKVSDILLKNRLIMNQKEGYYIFEPTGAGIDYITNEKIPLEDAYAIALMTDGYYAALSCYNVVSSWEELMNLLIDGKADEILNSIKKTSFDDNNLNQFPRFKLMDDSSVIVAKIK